MTCSCCFGWPIGFAFWSSPFACSRSVSPILRWTVQAPFSSPDLYHEWFPARCSWAYRFPYSNEPLRVVFSRLNRGLGINLGDLPWRIWTSYVWTAISFSSLSFSTSFFLFSKSSIYDVVFNWSILTLAISLRIFSSSTFSFYLMVYFFFLNFVCDLEGLFVEIWGGFFNRCVLAFFIN